MGESLILLSLKSAESTLRKVLQKTVCTDKCLDIIGHREKSKNTKLELFIALAKITSGVVFKKKKKRVFDILGIFRNLVKLDCAVIGY